MKRKRRTLKEREEFVLDNLTPYELARIVAKAWDVLDGHVFDSSACVAITEQLEDIALEVHHADFYEVEFPK